MMLCLQSKKNSDGADIEYEFRGNAFQRRGNGSSYTWTTNQPNYYLDTSFEDNTESINFCVGVDDTSDLRSEKWYYWCISGIKGITSNNYPNDGRFVVTAQRSYRLIGSGTWSVFAEEHEGIRFLGITSSQKWVPASGSAWVYAAANSAWVFNSYLDPVK